MPDDKIEINPRRMALAVLTAIGQAVLVLPLIWLVIHWIFQSSVIGWINWLAGQFPN